MDSEKKAVEEFWDKASCGEDLYLQNQQRDGYVAHARRRYELEPVIEEFASGAFDCVYSWGVLHHSPNTPRAIAEVHRVLRPGGVARIMIYHRWSLVGYMLWIRYALLRLRPWMSLTEVYARYLESPGTKAYSLSEARRMFAGFSDVKIRKWAAAKVRRVTRAVHAYPSREVRIDDAS